MRALILIVALLAGCKTTGGKVFGTTAVAAAVASVYTFDAGTEVTDPYFGESDRMERGAKLMFLSVGALAAWFAFEFIVGPSRGGGGGGGGWEASPALAVSEPVSEPAPAPATPPVVVVVPPPGGAVVERETVYQERTRVIEVVVPPPPPHVREHRHAHQHHRHHVKHDR